jgi:hypothetical protein
MVDEISRIVDSRGFPKREGEIKNRAIDRKSTIRSITTINSRSVNPAAAEGVCDVNLSWELFLI